MVVLGLGLGIVAGACAVGIFVYRNNKKVDKSDKFEKWNELQKNQITLDVLNVADVIRWAESVKNLTTESAQMMVTYANTNYLKKMGINSPVELDEKHNVLMSLIDKKSGRLLNVRLHSFDEMSEEMKKNFKDKDYFLIDDKN